MSYMEIDGGGNRRWHKEVESKKGKKKILHREDGPAFITENCRAWFIDDKFHREDGPAIEYFMRDRPDDVTDKSFYLNGSYIPDEDQYWKRVAELNPKTALSYEL